MKKITVLLADDHGVVRQGLRVLVETEGDIEVVSEAKTGREAIDMTLRLHPNVIVMDIAMPLLNGLQATREILRIAPATKVLILSAHADPEYVEQVVLLGAAGYLIKQSSADILVEAIRAVHKGKSFFSPSISKYLREHYQKTPRTAGLQKRKEECLTSREDQVLQLIAQAKPTNKSPPNSRLVSKPWKSIVSVSCRSWASTTLRVLLVTPLPRELLKATLSLL